MQVLSNHEPDHLAGMDRRLGAPRVLDGDAAVGLAPILTGPARPGSVR
jgi:hypothetical protein